MRRSYDDTPIAADDRTWTVDLAGSDQFRKSLDILRKLAGLGLAEWDPTEQVWRVRTTDAHYQDIIWEMAPSGYLATRGATITETTPQPEPAPAPAQPEPTPAADMVAALRAVGRTVRQIAAAIGCAISTVYRWAHGTNRPSARYAATLAAIA